MLIDVFIISGCALSSSAHFTHESFCYYDVEAVIAHGSTLSSGVAIQQKILLLMQLTVHWQWVISARWCNIWPYNPASISVQYQWIQETATDAAEIGSQDLDVLPKYAWVAWFSLAPVLYNSQEKVGLPCLILSMGAGLIGEFFKCNGVNALMWLVGDARCHFLMSGASMLHLRGHQAPLGDPIYSLHMSKMHGPFGVNLPDEGDIEGCKLIWRWHTVDMMRPQGR
jgi:hypothetical protein